MNCPKCGTEMIPGKAIRPDTDNLLEAALAEPNAEYERGVIDGMQRQAQSSVDRAVNRMSAAGHGMTWPGLASSSNGGNDD